MSSKAGFHAISWEASGSIHPWVWRGEVDVVGVEAGDDGGKRKPPQLEGAVV
jgi:hypothetical protein